MTKNTKAAINTLVFLSLGGVLFYWAIKNQDLDELWNQIKQVNLFWVGLSMVCGIISHLFRALRWNLLLEPMYKSYTKIVVSQVFGGRICGLVGGFYSLPC